MSKWQYPSPENILHFHDRSFSIRCDRIHYSEEAGYHVHPEMELAILKGGGGIRVVNDEEEKFGALDVVFSPGDLPHCWIFDGGKCPVDGAISDFSCQFSPAIFSGLTQTFPEFIPMVEFFLSLRQAIQITGQTAAIIADMFLDILNLSESRQVIRLLSIFNIIYESKEYRTIGMPLQDIGKRNRTNGRLHMIDRIVSENYHRKITLDEVASAIGMGTTNFCNIFKAMTGTTFNRYLTDYRMRIAARLLRESALNVSEIGYRVGYSDVAHFTRAFSSHFNMPPSLFRSTQADL